MPLTNQQLRALRELGIAPSRWGSSYRVRVRSRNGRITYISNVDRPQNRRLVADFYGIERTTLNSVLEGRAREPIFSRLESKKKVEYIWRNLTTESFVEYLSDILNRQESAFKLQIQFSYVLTNVATEEDIDFPFGNNTKYFEQPITINDRDQIEPRILSEMRNADFTSRISRPSSTYRVKEITGFNVIIFKRNHRLGDDVEIPKIIRDNNYTINFKNTRNKCIFYCIAYHLLDSAARKDKDTRKMVGPTKEVFKRYCTAENIKYTLKMFNEFEGVDIYHFTRIEEIFEINIDVFGMNVETGAVSCIRRSKRRYKNTMSVLDYEGHAIYITDIRGFENSRICDKCEMIFISAKKLGDHKRNRCDELYINSFPTKPTKYRVNENPIKKLLREYDIKGLDHFTDHFIVYDFEAILAKTDDQRGANTLFVSKHIPVSVSICNSLTFEKRCFVEDDPKELLRKMFEYIYEVRDVIVYELKKKFHPLIAAINENHFTNKDLEALEKVIESVPVIGFNSGKYDINMCAKELFSVIGDEVVSAIKSTSYMCITTKKLKMLDISNYLPAGTSYTKYLETYLGECECPDKIRCVCELSKGVFPYEYIDSFQRLSETSLPPKEAFYSSLRKSHITDEEYERACFIWDHYEMKTLKDFLVWYNNLDVVPFVKAIIKQRLFYTERELDMFVDGVSLPGLAEKVLFHRAMKDLPKQHRPIGSPFSFPAKRLDGYRRQDQENGHEFGLTLVHLNKLLKQARYTCSHCYCLLDEQNVSADRVSNTLGHIDENVMISCVSCNVARKNMNPKSFRYKKYLDFNSERLVHSIDEEHKEIYSMIKNNICGGPSIIFNRYAKRNETKIRGCKKVRKVIGYDANALYLWAMGNVMPCGRLVKDDAYDGIIDDIMNDKIFGFLECDIETPEHLKEYFSEMTPIFKNVEIDSTDKAVIGSHMYEHNEKRMEQYRNEKKSNPNAILPSINTKSRKLIGSYFGVKVLIYTPLLKWYIKHGMAITKSYCFVKASPYRPFKGFMEEVSDARREGSGVVSEGMKLCGNSAAGKFGMDKTKHKNIKFTKSVEHAEELMEHFTFHHIEEYGEAYELTMSKRRIKLNNPIQISHAIYQLAKLRMLEFYYDLLDKYIDRSDFQYQEMDTDSAYIAFSAENPFPDLVRPELRSEFDKEKHDWFPRDDTEEHKKYDSRTPGLFKEEWRGEGMISLSSKNYICFYPDEGYKEKLSSKGVQKRLNKATLTPENFKTVIDDKVSMMATNHGFRIDRNTNSVITYQQLKTGCSYYYDKRKVLGDGITTVPLDI